MKCIIVDDEPLAREGIELNIQELQYLELVGQFGNALKANDFLSIYEVDLMFLDIQMPGLTGLDFIRTLKNPPMIILTTAYPQYALEGFELNVIDYLVKPIRLQRFVAAVNKAKAQDELKRAANKVDIDTISEDYIYIKSDRQYVRLFFEDILYIQGMKDYVLIHTVEKKYITAMNVKTILKQLPPTIFARVSKSYIVNVNQISSVDIDLIKLRKIEIPLGRTYREDFIKNYVKTNLIDRK